MPRLLSTTKFERKIVVYQATIANERGAQRIRVTISYEQRWEYRNPSMSVFPLNIFLGRYAAGNTGTFDGMFLTVDDLDIISATSTSSAKKVDSHSLEIQFLEDNVVVLGTEYGPRNNGFVMTMDSFKELQNFCPALIYIFHSYNAPVKYDIAKNCVIRTMCFCRDILYQSNTFGGSLEADIEKATPGCIVKLSTIERTLRFSHYQTLSLLRNPRLPGWVLNCYENRSDGNMKQNQLMRKIWENEM